MCRFILGHKWSKEGWLDNPDGHRLMYWIRYCRLCKRIEFSTGGGFSNKWVPYSEMNSVDLKYFNLYGLEVNENSIVKNPAKIKIKGS